MKKFVTVLLVLLVCLSSVSVPDAEARKRKGLKVGSTQWAYFWNLFWLANYRKLQSTPGWTPYPDAWALASVTGTLLTSKPAPAPPAPPTPFVPPSPAAATTLTFSNTSGTDVYLCVSTQSGNQPCTAPSIMQDGCPSNVSQLGVVDLATNAAGSFVQWPSSSPQTGWFLWKNGHTLQVYNNMTNPYTGLNNGCLQGLVFGVNVWGANCGCNIQPPPPNPFPANSQICNGFPDTDPSSINYNSDTPGSYSVLPNGSTAFEPSLNLPGLQCNVAFGNNPHESYDITCVNGSNAIFSVTMTPPAAGPFFTYDVGNGSQTANTSFTTQNSWVLVNPPAVKASCDDNCIDPNAAIAGSSRAGVYPYGATVCTVNPDNAAPCNTTADPYALNKQFCAATAGSGCNFDRAPLAGQVFGGTLAVTYTGPATPPAACP